MSETATMFEVIRTPMTGDTLALFDDLKARLADVDADYVRRIARYPDRAPELHREALLARAPLANMLTHIAELHDRANPPIYRVRSLPEAAFVRVTLTP